MWPPLNHLHPAVAGSLLSYRFARDTHADRAAKATENARSYGLPGQERRFIGNRGYSPTLINEMSLLQTLRSQCNN